MSGGWRDRRGSSALECALTLPVLLTLAGGLADVGLLWRVAGQLGAAVGAGAQYAVLAGATATQTNLQNAIKAASPLSGMTASATAPACYCLNSSGSTLALSFSSCGATCSDGKAPGTYVTLTASYTYQPILPGFSHLARTTRTERATVRVK